MRRDAVIPRPMREQVERELESGERIVWMERPIPRFFTGPALGVFLFAIPWTAFAVFWMVGAGALTWFTGGEDGGDSEGGPGLVFRFFPCFGLPFVLIGLGLLSAPIWVYRKALRTIYVITDRRAIRFAGGRMTNVRSYRPDQLTDLQRREKADGSGDVVFGRTPFTTWRDMDSTTAEYGFFRVRNAQEVERLLRQLAEQHADAGDTP